MWDDLSSLNWINLGRFIDSSIKDLIRNENNFRILSPSEKNENNESRAGVATKPMRCSNKWKNGVY